MRRELRQAGDRHQTRKGNASRKGREGYWRTAIRLRCATTRQAKLSELIRANPT